MRWRPPLERLAIALRKAHFFVSTMHNGYIQRRIKCPGNEKMGGRKKMKLRKKLWKTKTEGRSKNVWQNLASVGKALLQLVFKFCIDSFKWPMR